MERIAGAIVIAGALIAAAIYLKPSPPGPRYTMPETAYRLDTYTGEFAVCPMDGSGCVEIGDGGPAKLVRRAPQSAD